MELVEQRRKLAETERRALETLMAYVTPAQMSAFLGALYVAIEETVSKPEREQLGRRLRHLLNTGPHNGGVPG